MLCLFMFGRELAEIFPPGLEIAFTWGGGLGCGGSRVQAMDMTGSLVVCAGGGGVDIGRHDGGASARRGRGTRWVCRSVQSTSSVVAAVIEARMRCLTG